MKFNRKCVKNMCVILGAYFLFFSTACDRQSSYSHLLTEEYPKLYQYVFERNADSLLSFTDHPDTYIKDQAWRALISTSIEAEDLDDFITKVQYQNSMIGWTALSKQELNERQISRLQDLWNQRVSMREGISLVLGLQGNESSLNFLVVNFENFIDTNYEFESALAISRLMTRYELGSTSKKVLFKYGAIIDDPDLFRAYFYGLYRSGSGLETEELRDIMFDTYNYASNSKIKQYAAQILFNTDSEWFFENISVDEFSDSDVQFAIEVAQLSGSLDWNEKLESFYLELLVHSNPVVNEVAINQIANHTQAPINFDEYIIERIVENEAKEPSVRLSGISALSNVDEYLALAEQLAEDNEYLLEKELAIKQHALDVEGFIDNVSDHFESENLISNTLAIQALSGWWQELSEADQADNRVRIREELFALLDKRDRTITFYVINLLNEAGLVEGGDFQRFEKLTEEYVLPEDVEVFQALGSLLREHFEVRGTTVVQELAQQGNSALNNALQQQGWDIEGQPSPKKFRNPDWKRLAEMNYEPVWVLQTEKGDIKIALDVLLAPATISGIDSLTTAGAYDGVAFHRVVPNFVIQGGDVETGLGLGGPDYIVPTEASEKKYKRSVAGIASAGTDTEGSQYFVMHQWKPHLNAGYTVIGEVVEGMDIVDRILVGDKVERAYMEIQEDQ